MRPTPSIRDFTAEEDLLGFFGPDSVTWRIHADPAFSVGGIRALLLQALHPVAMDGVARFSGGFRDEPWPRLIRTATYVDTLTFGTRTEAVSDTEGYFVVRLPPPSGALASPWTQGTVALRGDVVPPRPAGA